MKWMLNHQLVDENQLVISLKEHGLLYGVGLFETIRVYEGVPFLLDEHLERMEHGLPQIGIRYNFNKQRIKKDISRLLKENNLSNAYLRLTITGGVSEFGMPTDFYVNPTILCQIKPMPFSQNQVYPKNAVILETRRNSPETTQRLKTLNFLNNIIAKMEIKDLDNTEGIFLNTEGFLAEGTVSNLFFVKNGILHTPAINTGLLNGITRRHVLLLAGKIDIGIKEGYFLPSDLKAADEIFITNSIQELVPIKQLEEIKFNDKENLITNKLINEYRQSVEIAIEKGWRINEA